MHKSLLGVAFLSVSVLPVFAEVPPPPGGVKPEIQAIRSDIKEDRQGLREEVKNVREDRREDVKTIRTEAQDKIKDLRMAGKTSSTPSTTLKDKLKSELDAMREGVKAVRMEAREAIEGARTRFLDAVKEKRELIKSKLDENREALQKRVQSFKDDRKKQVATNVSDNLGKANEAATNNLSKALDQMADVLSRISSRADKAEDSGLDVAAVRVEISNASSAIATARTAVIAQAGKIYPVSVSSEDGLKNDLSRVRKALHDDIEKVRALVKAAREAVHKAATTLAQIPRINEITIPTTTVTSTASTTSQ